jgi:hypothetical protein
MQSAPNLIPASAPVRPASESTWLFRGYVLIALCLVARWLYIASGIIRLSEDEAYQWLWSKHLALSYFSKPLGIAFIQRAGTAIGGDTDFGVRFFSPVFAAILGVIVLRFLAREIGARTTFWMLLVTLATPLLGVGSVLMTIDPPLVLGWMWAVIAGWRAVQPDGKTRDWLVVGVAMAFAVLCKQSALYLVICWAIYFALQPTARIHLRKPGPWLALAIFMLGLLPMLYWNSQHGWITAHHVADNAGMTHEWHFTLSYFFEFIGLELLLLNPIFLVAALWASFAFWKQRREKPLWLFLFCMGTPVFLGHIVYSLHSRILPNWIAPVIPPMFCLMALYWHQHRWAIKPWVTTGIVLGLVASIVMHDINLIGLVIRPLPGDIDPTHRLGCGYPEAAAFIENERQQFDTASFIIADRYGSAGLYTFYSAPARAAAIAHQPLVYCEGADRPINQFYFWPEYNYFATRHGENALYIRRLDPYKLERDWVWKWLWNEPIEFREVAPQRPPPADIAAHFESITNLGLFEIKVADGRIFQRIQIFGCYHLK